jgi:hypothetical protein
MLFTLYSRRLMHTYCMQDDAIGGMVRALAETLAVSGRRGMRPANGRTAIRMTTLSGFHFPFSKINSISPAAYAEKQIRVHMP